MIGIQVNASFHPPCALALGVLWSEDLGRRKWPAFLLEAWDEIQQDEVGAAGYREIFRWGTTKTSDHKFCCFLIVWRREHAPSQKLAPRQLRPGKVEVHKASRKNWYRNNNQVIGHLEESRWVWVKNTLAHHSVAILSWDLHKQKAVDHRPVGSSGIRNLSGIKSLKRKCGWKGVSHKQWFICLLRTVNPRNRTKIPHTCSIPYFLLAPTSRFFSSAGTWLFCSNCKRFTL